MTSQQHVHYIIYWTRLAIPCFSPPAPTLHWVELEQDRRGQALRKAAAGAYPYQQRKQAMTVEAAGCQRPQSGLRTVRPRVWPPPNYCNNVMTGGTYKNNWTMVLSVHDVRALAAS